MAQLDNIELKNGTLIKDLEQDLIQGQENVLFTLDTTTSEHQGATFEYIIYTQTFQRKGKLSLLWNSTNIVINEVYSDEFNNVNNYVINFQARLNGTTVEVFLDVPASTETWKFESLVYLV